MKKNNLLLSAIALLSISANCTTKTVTVEEQTGIIPGVNYADVKFAGKNLLLTPKQVEMFNDLKKIGALDDCNRFFEHQAHWLLEGEAGKWRGRWPHYDARIGFSETPFRETCHLAIHRTTGYTKGDEILRSANTKLGQAAKFIEDGTKKIETAQNNIKKANKIETEANTKMEDGNKLVRAGTALVRRAEKMFDEGYPDESEKLKEDGQSRIKQGESILDQIEQSRSLAKQFRTEAQELMVTGKNLKEKGEKLAQEGEELKQQATKLQADSLKVQESFDLAFPKDKK